MSRSGAAACGPRDTYRRHVSPGRGPAYVLGLPASALLVLAFLATPPFVPHAEAQSDTVWTPTSFRAQSLGSGKYGCDGGRTPSSRKCSTTTTLSNNSVTYDGSTYVIKELYSRAADGGTVRLRFTSDPSDAFIAAIKLKIGSVELSLATPTNFAFGDRFTWEETGVTWSSGQQVNNLSMIAEAASVTSLVSKTVSGTSLVLTFTGELDSTSVPPNSAFTVKRTPFGGMEETVALAADSAVAIDGETVTLTLASAVLPYDSVTVSYTKPETGPKLQDTSANEVDSIDESGVNNETRVKVASAEVSGKQLTITFDTPLNRTNMFCTRIECIVLVGIPPNSAFTVKKTPSGGMEETVAIASDSAAAIGERTVTLTLGSAVLPGETVTVSYTKPETGGRIYDSDGGAVDSFENLPVTNNSKPPEVSEALVSVTTLVLTFDTEMDPDSTPSGTAFAVKKTRSGETIAETVALASDNAAVIDGKTLTLTLDSDALPAKTVKVSYTKPQTGNKLQDLLANEVDSFSDNTARAVLPGLSTARVNRTSLVLTFDMGLAAAANLANSAFTVKKAVTGGGTTTLTLDSGTAPVISNNRVTLTLASTSAVMWNDTGVTVTYSKPGTGTKNLLVGDRSGTEVATFTDEPVVNELYVAVEPDCAAPTVTGRTVIWASTVTVGSALFVGFGSNYGYSPGGPRYGTLSDNSFTIGSRRYTVDLVFVRSGVQNNGLLVFSMTSEFAGVDIARVRLHVCDDAFDPIAANRAGVSALNYRFVNSGLDWSSNSSRTLRLSVPTTSVPAALVSNFGQMHDSEQNDARDARAQHFSTGSDPGGYTLSSIGVITRENDSTPFSATVCRATSSGSPPVAQSRLASDSRCLRLTPPANFGRGINTFTAPPGSTLAPSTSYTVVFQAPSGAVDYITTTSFSEDEASAGWTLGDSYFRNTDTGWSRHTIQSDFVGLLFVAVRGEPRSPSDGSLSALVLSDGDVSPAFSSAQETYTAGVGQSVERITVTATPHPVH